jgi:DNA-binding Lrp family transcriptional regulator
MDEGDRRLLAEPRRDGRATLSKLAARLAVSRAKVRARMERLTVRGEIAGFTVVTRSDTGQAPVRGLMMIGIEGRGTEKITAQLTGLPAVQAVHSTNGKWDLVAELGAQTLQELDEVLAAICNLEGVVTSETNLRPTTRRAGRR